MNQHIGNLFILSAPSGAGKSSLYKALLKNDDKVRISVSHTTREPRSGEEYGREYFFTKVQDFIKMIEKDAFFEHARVFDNFYGTTKISVFKMLKQGLDVILEIDWQGARQVRHVHPDVISLFILPPSLKTLEDRLKGRGTDSQDIIARRMSKAVNEMTHYHEYDFVIVNDDFDTALATMQAIFTAMRCKTKRIQKKNDNLISDLLSS